MDEKDVLALLTATRTGSFSKAAEVLGYTQPGLTAMMNRLEGELGCKLLSRNYSGVQLTPEGRHLLPYFQSTAQSFQMLWQAVRRLQETDQEMICIGSYPSIAKSLLPPLIKRFKMHYPHVDLELRIGGYDIRDWLTAGTVDLAFVDESLGGPNWVALLEDPYYAAVSSACALSGKESVSIQELTEYPFILSQINELKPLTYLSGLQENIHITATDDTALLSLVEQGLGVTLLPASALRGHSDGIRVLELNPPMRRTIGITRSQTVSGQASRFVEFVRQEVREESRSGLNRMEM